MQKSVLQKNRGKLLVIVLTMVFALGVAGISAYFTDADTATNTFTIGDISLDLQEPGWDPTPENPDDPDVPGDPNDVTPNEEIEKDPQILNDGENDMYVFLKVEMPYAELVTANADGTKNDAAWMEMFTYEINDGWVKVGETVIDKDAGTSTQVYAYAVDDELVALVPEQRTVALFDSVTFQNVVEDQGLEGSVEEIVITAYGIQTSNINGGKTDPAGVWEVILNQNPNTAVDAPENADSDIKE